MTFDPQVDEIRHRAQALEKRWMQSLTGEDVRAYLAEEVDDAVVGLLAALEDAQQRLRDEYQRGWKHGCDETLALCIGDVEQDVIRNLIEDVKRVKSQLTEAQAELAVCYKLTGADPDSNPDEHLAPHAVTEVARMFHEMNDLRNELAEARAALQATPTCPNHGPMTLVLAQHRCDVCGAFDEVSEVKS